MIAKNLRSNVRELEGALRKVMAYSSFHGRVVTVDIAREALKDLLSASTGQVTVELIQKTVADYYKIKVADMYSKRRPIAIALAAPGGDVPGEGTDAEEPAGDRRTVRRAATTRRCCTPFERSAASATRIPK